MRRNYIAAMGGAQYDHVDDTYPLANDDLEAFTLFSTGNNGVAQSFISSGGQIFSITFNLQKTGSPTGTSVAKLYAATGTHGTDAIPTGAALAPSGTLDVSTLTTSVVATTLTFTGAQRYFMTRGTVYCIAFEYSGGDSSNKLFLGADGSGPTHDGNSSSEDNASIWSTSAFTQARDVVFVLRAL